MSSALPASETAVGQKSREFDNEDLPSSASRKTAATTEEGIAEEPWWRFCQSDNGAHGFGIVSAGVFGGRLRQNTASSEEELCQVVCLTKAKQYSLVAKKNETSENC